MKDERLHEILSIKLNSIIIFLFLIILSNFLSPGLSHAYKRWNFSSNEEGWTGRNGTYVVQTGDNGGQLTVNTVGNDPGIVSPNLSLSASSNNLLKMRVATFCSDKNATIYFKRSGSSTVYTGGTTYYSNGDSWGTYEVNMSGNSNWTGTITQIRIDPAGSCGSSESPGFIAFDWIEVTSAPTPDLIVQSQSANPTSVEAGSTTYISCTVKNQGSGSAGSSYVKYYISSNTSYSTSDPYLGSDYVSSLSSGATSSESATVTIPGNTSAGTKYILFYADKDGSVPESNESNNISYKQITVTIPLPGTPSLVSPNDHLIRYNQTPHDFDWGSVTGAVKYRIYVDNHSGFGSPEINVEPAGSSLSSSVTLPNNVYFWKVQAQNSAGQWGSWSSIRQFVVDTPPPAPTLNSPANGSQYTNGASASFSWSGPVDYSIDRYYLRIVQGTNLDDTPVYSQEMYPTSQTISTTGWTPGTYTWAVRAIKNHPDGYNQSTYETTISWGQYATRTIIIGSDSPPYFNPAPTLQEAVDLGGGPIYFTGTGRDDIGLKNVRMVVSGPRGNNIEAFPAAAVSGTSVSLSSYYFDPSNATYAGLAGTYTVQLIITDTWDQTASKTFTVLVTQLPEGTLDAADCTSIRGWAKDPDTANSIDVSIYADGDSSSGTLIGTYPADVYRSDLGGNYGFNVPTPISLKDGSSHQVYVYAIDANNGTPINLPGSPKAITCSLPIPTGFTAISFQDGIRLSWNEVSDVPNPEYQIFWGLDNSVSDINHSGTFTTSTTVSDHRPLDAEEEYFYVVRTCSDGLCGDLSSYQSAVVAKGELTISMQALPTNINERNAQLGTTYPITCTVNRTGGRLRPTTDYVRVYVYMNQSTDPSTVLPEHLVLENTGTTLDFPVTELDDGTETKTDFNIPIPTTIEGPHYIHVKVDGPDYWSESNETNNWATSSNTVAVWRDEIPTTASDNGILARTWDNAHVYWISKYGKKWQLTGIESDPGYPVEQLGYTDADVHWYRSGAFDSLEVARDILKDDNNFVYRRQGTAPEDSTVFIVRNGVSDWFFNWDTFMNSQFGTEDVYWATDAGFDWIQLFYPPGQMIGLQPRIRVVPNKLLFE